MPYRFLLTLQRDMEFGVVGLAGTWSLSFVTYDIWKQSLSEFLVWFCRWHSIFNALPIRTDTRYHLFWIHSGFTSPTAMRCFIPDCCYRSIFLSPVICFFKHRSFVLRLRRESHTETRSHNFSDKSYVSKTTKRFT